MLALALHSIEDWDEVWNLKNYYTANNPSKLAKRTHNEYDLIRMKCGTKAFGGDSMAKIQEIPIRQIRRPLYRQNDQAKVTALMESIQKIGLQEPIDVLEVDGEYYGFSGCHRYEACDRLGQETIRCQVRHAPRSVLRMHLA